MYSTEFVKFLLSYGRKDCQEPKSENIILDEINLNNQTIYRFAKFSTIPSRAEK